MSPHAIDVISPNDETIDRVPTVGDQTPNLESRVVDAALECFARWGIAKTTAEDIAREAGVSRATVYRSFPGGRAAILEAVSRNELGRLVGEVQAAIGSVETLDDLLVEGILAASGALRSHRALNFLMAHEPEAVLPFLAFDRLGPTLRLCSATFAPSVARFVPQGTAEEIVEWATRMVLSLTFAPGLADVTDPAAVRSIVVGMFLPGFAEERLPTSATQLSTESAQLTTESAQPTPELPTEREAP